MRKRLLEKVLLLDFEPYDKQTVVVVVDALVNFPVLENYADFLLEFCVGALGIGAGSSRLEENPEIEDVEQKGAVPSTHPCLVYQISF